PFQQADAGIARRFGGTGLGLTIVNRLVQMLRGQIRMESRLNAGSCVHISLPVPAQPDAQTRRADLSRPPGTATLSKHSLRDLRILIADDNAANRKLLSVMSTRLGLRCALATDGVEAVALWRAEPFDIVLLDISMPRMSGIEALRLMQDEARRLQRPAPRALAATANVMPEQIESYLAAGFVAVLPKPFRSADFVRLVQHVHQAQGTDAAARGALDGADVTPRAP
ncbi:MAG: ATP-binding response regulator, partial [Roseinatronobacter sp.]